MSHLSINLIKGLYYKELLSTVEISQKLKITPWAVISFMRRNSLPRRTFSEANRKRFDKKPLSFHIKRNLSLRERGLKTAGILLYWAEGAKINNKKRNYTVDFANCDPRMIKIFVKFLREICRVDEKRLRVFLYCYGDQDVEKIVNYWYKLTRIPLAQFTKPYIRNDFLPEKSGKMEYGLVHIRYADKKLLLQIGKWIQEYCRRNNI